MRALIAVSLLAACSSRPTPATPPAAPPPPDAAVDAANAVAAPAPLPIARTVDTVDDQFGLKVADPYRWMETEHDETAGWLRAQGAHGASALSGIAGRDALRARIEGLSLDAASPSTLSLAGGRAFYLYVGAGEQLARLMVRDPGGADRVLVDPATLARGDSPVAITTYAPSPDGSLVAYNVTSGGSELTTVRVLDVATGAVQPDTIERIWGEFDVSWLPDSSGFFYTAMAAPADGVDPMLNMQVRLHRLGQPIDRDVAVLGGGVGRWLIAPEDFPFVMVAPGTPWMIAISGGAHAGVQMAIAKLATLDTSGGGATPWRPVAGIADGVSQAVIHGDRVYLLADHGAPHRRLISVPVASPDLRKAKVEVAEDPDAVVVGIAATPSALYLQQMVAGAGRVVRRPWRGKPAMVALPYPGWVSALATDPLRDGATLALVSWTRPTAYFTHDARTGAVAPMGLASTSPADFTGIVADEVEATSADGTRVPLSILHRADAALDGSHPALLTGYGAYGTSATPSFSGTRLAWLERGGVIAFAHVRGGGDRGEEWHRAGSREHKLDGVRDFIACGEYLIAHGYARAGALTAEGRSAGGILVGRAMTLRPELFAGVAIGVGMVNPLRILAARNGANQKAEFGDPETEDGYRMLAAMDPYVHAEPAAYPTVLFTIGLNDSRVEPWMTAKMAARLLAGTTSGRPILIRTDEQAGHGVGSTRGQAAAERADLYAFELAAAGDPDFQ